MDMINPWFNNWINKELEALKEEAHKKAQREKISKHMIDEFLTPDFIIREGGFYE